MLEPLTNRRARALLRRAAFSSPSFASLSRARLTICFWFGMHRPRTPRPASPRSVRRPSAIRGHWWPHQRMQQSRSMLLKSSTRTTATWPLLSAATCSAQLEQANACIACSPPTPSSCTRELVIAYYLRLVWLVLRSCSLLVLMRMRMRFKIPSDLFYSYRIY